MIRRTPPVLPPACIAALALVVGAAVAHAARPNPPRAPAPSAAVFVAPAPSAAVFVAPAPSAAVFVAPAPSAAVFVAPAPSAAVFVAPAPLAAVFVAPAPSAAVFVAPAPSAAVFVEPAPPALVLPAAPAAPFVGGAARASSMRERLRALRAPAAPAIAMPQPVPMALPVPCRPRDRSGARTPPSDALRNAFAILRRERADADALTPEALRALKAAGLEPVDPRSARLLRADGAARAWVVPVPDVDVALGLIPCVPREGAAHAREGLAVVSVGGAAAGGGGALRDLRRGLAPATVDPCAGAAGDMLGISGVVPDGVEAVFVTAADGTATRADVRDNGYAFVLPRPRRPEPRYLVWTGSDGAPRVQPLPALFVRGRGAGCAPTNPPPRVTPDPSSTSCGPLAPPALPAPAFMRPALPAPALVRPTTPRPAPAPKRRSRRPSSPRRAPSPILRTPAPPRPIRVPPSISRRPIVLWCGPAFRPAAVLPGPARVPRPAPVPPRPRRGP